MNKLDNELECRARELLAYLDTDLAVEESLPFIVDVLVKKMRAAVFAKAARTAGATCDNLLCESLVSLGLSNWRG
jgi:hypothetical protein